MCVFNLTFHSAVEEVENMSRLPFRAHTQASIVHAYFKIHAKRASLGFAGITKQGNARLGADVGCRASWWRKQTFEIGISSAKSTSVGGKREKPQTPTDQVSL